MRETPEEFEADYLGKDELMETGFDGTPKEWEHARKLIAEAIDHDGTLLDLGCANGKLAQDLQKWAKEKSFTLKVFGVDFSPKLVAKAQERFPQNPENFVVGDVNTYSPAQKMDYIRTEYVYFSPLTLEHLTQQLKRYFDAIKPGGKLIITFYQDDKHIDTRDFKSSIEDLGLGKVDLIENEETTMAIIQKSLN